MTSPRIWLISSTLSALVHAVVIAASIMRPGVPPREAAPLSHRDIRFLLENLRGGEEVPPSAPELARRPAPPAPAPVRTSVPSSVPPSRADALTVAAAGDADARVRAEAASPAAPEVPIRDVAPSAPVPPPARPPRAAAVTVGLERPAQQVGLLSRPSREEELPVAVRFYRDRLRYRIERNVRFPDDPSVYGLRGTVELQIAIDREGDIQAVRFLRHANHPILDVIAQQAILRSAPFPALGGAIDLNLVLFNISVVF